MSALVRFVVHPEESPHLEQGLRGSAHISQVIELAAECGFALCLEYLRSASKELFAPWWPWSGRERAWCRAFLFTQNAKSKMPAQHLSGRLSLISVLAKTVLELLLT